MKLFRISTILTLLIAAVFGVLLFWTSQDVQKKERELAKTKAELAQERETVRVLSVEWDYLNRPQRLEELAKELGMQLPVAGEVVSGMDQIPEPVQPAADDIAPLMEEAVTQAVSVDVPEAVAPQKIEPAAAPAQQPTVHDVSMDAPYSPSRVYLQVPAPKQVPKKAEILSPSSAEKQSFDRLIESLDQEGAQ